MSEPPIRPYKIKLEPIGEPGDPIWEALERMRLTRIKAMRHALDSGEPYRDPYAEDLPYPGEAAG